LKRSLSGAAIFDVVIEDLGDSKRVTNKNANLAPLYQPPPFLRRGT